MKSILNLAAEFGVKRIGLFGSYARDAADEDSDIDLVVEFERPIGFKFIELETPDRAATRISW